MSSDDGVYVLVTRGAKKRGRGYKKVYRVAWAQAIENIWDEVFDPSTQRITYRLNPEYAREVFGNSPVWPTMQEALMHAVRMYEKLSGGSFGPEYGIKPLDFRREPFPALVAVN